MTNTEEIDYRTKIEDTENILIAMDINPEKWKQFQRMYLGLEVIFVRDDMNGTIEHIGLINHPTEGILPFANVRFPEENIISSICLDGLINCQDKPICNWDEWKGDPK